MDWLMLSGELDAGEVWVRSMTDGLSWALFLWAALAGVVLILAPLAAAQTFMRRRFWCGLAGRAVEVEFEMLGPIGLRRAVAVQSCSAFSPVCRVSCSQACLDRKLRRALPVTASPAGGMP